MPCGNRLDCRRHRLPAAAAVAVRPSPRRNRSVPRPRNPKNRTNSDQAAGERRQRPGAQPADRRPQADGADPPRRGAEPSPRHRRADRGHAADHRRQVRPPPPEVHRRPTHPPDEGPRPRGAVQPGRAERDRQPRHRFVCRHRRARARSPQPGAARATFIERHYPTAATIKENIASLDVGRRSRALTRATRFCTCASSRTWGPSRGWCSVLRRMIFTSTARTTCG